MCRKAQLSACIITKGFENTGLHWLQNCCRSLWVTHRETTNPTNKMMNMLVRLVNVCVALTLLLPVITMAELALRSKDPT
jgi:hypothetical protein